MKSGTALLLIGGAVGVYYLTRATAAKRLNFYPGQIQGMAFEDFTPMIYLDFIVQNTSNADITLHSIAGNAYSNGYMVGNISNFQGVVVRGNGETRVPVLVRLNLINVVNDLMNAWQTGSFKQDISIAGRANAEGLSVPINLKFTV
jgi:LEA14-like dessication related protein